MLAQEQALEYIPELGSQTAAKEDTDKFKIMLYLHSKIQNTVANGCLFSFIAHL